MWKSCFLWISWILSNYVFEDFSTENWKFMKNFLRVRVFSSLQMYVSQRWNFQSEFLISQTRRYQGKIIPLSISHCFIFFFQPNNDEDFRYFKRFRRIFLLIFLFCLNIPAQLNRFLKSTEWVKFARILFLKLSLWIFKSDIDINVAPQERPEKQQLLQNSFLFIVAEMNLYTEDLSFSQYQDHYPIGQKTQRI